MDRVDRVSGAGVPHESDDVPDSRAGAPPPPGGVRSVFYGWYLVAAVGFVLTVVSGLTFYNLTVLLKAFIAERGFSVAVASGATAAFFVASGLAGAVTGRFIDRFDARITIIGGALLASATLAMVGYITSVQQLYLFHIVFGIAYGLCGLVPGTTLVARWFDRRRSLALSMASTGLSLGGVLLTPSSAYLIQQVGLTEAGRWLALVFLLGVVPMTALVIRPSPQSMGLAPDGERPAPARPDPSVAAENGAARARPAGGGPAAQAGTPFAEAVRHPFFIGLLAAYIFALGSQVGALSHLYRMASTRADDATAAAAVACLAGASIVGRLFSGWLLLKISARGFTLAIIAMQGLGLVFLAYAATPHQILLGAVLLGVNVGNVLMMQALLLAETFGTRDYGRIFSVCQMGTMIGVAGGPFLVGAICQATGDYIAAYLAAALCSGLGCVLLVGAIGAERRYRPRPARAGTASGG